MAKISNVDTAMFDRTMLKYMKASKKSAREALNTKAYWIAYNAIKFTKVANKQEILSYTKNWNRVGPTIIKAFKLDRSKAFSKAKMMTKFSKFRTRSIGYLRSGWLQTLRAAGGWAKQKKTFKGVRMKGRKKGWCKLARDAWDLKVSFSNTTGHDKKQQQAAKKFIKPALQKAINKEAQSMAKYILKKNAEAARRSGIKRVRLS